MTAFAPPDAPTVLAAESFRRRKATSVLTIVFTDIVSSTQLREDLGEHQYEALREEYDDIFGSIVSRDDAGAVVKSTGDGALCVFSEPSLAVERLLEVQRSLGPHPTFRLRVGLDLGQVSVKASFGIVADVFGRHVNRSQRIQSLAEPGHILTSFNVYDCAVGWLHSDSVKWATHGLASLKGFKDGVSVHEVYDPNQTTPQSAAHFPRPEPNHVMFSRAAVRQTRAVRVDAVSWTRAIVGVRATVARLDSSREDVLAQHIDSYRDGLADRARKLTAWSPPALQILWIAKTAASPGALVRATLEDAAIGVTQAPSFETAIERSQPDAFAMFIYEVADESELAEALRFAAWQKRHPSGGPVAIFGSVALEGEYEELALVTGAALCTAGVATLLHAIGQVLDTLRRSLPVEFLDTETVDYDAGISAKDRSTWLSRLKNVLVR
jgi:class 3 adenylate cyclase